MLRVTVSMEVEYGTKQSSTLLGCVPQVRTGARAQDRNRTPEGSEDDARGSVSRLDPGAEIETLSGTFRTEVFDGPYMDAGRWRKQLATTLAAEGHEAQDIYAFYTTWPRCAKVYGHNYVVLLARV
jgi:hypothetical protein